MLAEQSTNTRVIKKYQNRKLYDTKDSCYVTLDEIAKLIRKGEEVCVLDNRTKNDVTSLILTQILVDQEKSAKSILPLSMLRNIIQRGQGSLFDFIQRYVLLGVDSEQDKRAEAERYIDRMVVRGELTKAEGKSLLKEVLDTPEQAQTELDAMIGQRVAAALKDKTNLSEIDQTISQLATRIENLERRITEFEAR